MKFEVNEDTAGTETQATETSSPWKQKFLCNMQRFAKDKIKCQYFLIIHLDETSHSLTSLTTELF